MGCLLVYTFEDRTVFCPTAEIQPGDTALSDTSNPESYQVLARRCRPTTFAELVGQTAILESLSGALKSGRMPHAFLFSGSRGVGKTTLARILARCLNCETGVTDVPCGECAQCRSILDGSNGDVLEIDAASHNLVDDIRELRDRVGFVSMGARYKVYILDEVHMLTRSAFNAFLKTLEEPPDGVVFILATTELHKVPETIQSRCQVLLFQRLAEGDIVERLRSISAAEGLSIPDELLHEIGRSVRGGMRDAETALERILPMAHELGSAFGIEDYRRIVHRAGLGEVVEVVEGLLRGEAASAMHFVDGLVAGGVDEREVLGEILEVLRALLLLAIDGPDTGLVSMGGELRTRLQGLAEGVDLVRVDAMVQAGLNGRERIRQVDDRRLVLEISLLRMAQAGRLTTLAQLVEQARTGALPVATEPAPVSPGSASPASVRAATVSPATAQQASPGDAGGSLASRLMALCTRRRGLLTRTLEYCSIGEADDKGVVAIVVRTDMGLHRDRMMSDGVQGELREMIREILGHPVQLTVTLAAGAAAEPEAAPKAEAEVEPGPGVREVIDRFDGKIHDVARGDQPGPRDQSQS